MTLQRTTCCASPSPQAVQCTLKQRVAIGCQRGTETEHQHMASEITITNSELTYLFGVLLESITIYLLFVL
jgi:hypothetical protein